MKKSNIALLVVIELALLAVIILFWGSIASIVSIILFCILLIDVLMRKFAPFMKARDYGGINKEYDDLDPVNLFYKKHMDTVDIESEDEE